MINRGWISWREQKDLTPFLSQAVYTHHFNDCINFEIIWMRELLILNKIELRSAAYFSFIGLTSFNIGAYLILTSWLAVELTGNAKLASALFLVSLVLGLILANIAGVLAAPHRIKMIFYVACTVRALSGAILAIPLFANYRMDIALISFVILRSAANSFIAPASSVAFQSCFHKEIRSKRIAEAGIVNQLGIALGTGVAGIMISTSGLTGTAFFLMLIAIIQMFFIPIFTVNEPLKVVEDKLLQQSFYSKWREGFQFVCANQSILIALLVMSITVSVAQMTNVLVPVFVMNDLLESVELYGVLEMSWALGGILTLILARHLFKGVTSLVLSTYFLTASGVAMIVFANTSTHMVLLVIYCILGGLFNIIRFISNSKIMIEVDQYMIGRVRGVSQLLTNAIGIAIFFIPWLFDTSFVKNIYILWGLIIICLSIVLRLVLTRERD